jgi:hypothetical protein
MRRLVGSKAPTTTGMRQRTKIVQINARFGLARVGMGVKFDRSQILIILDGWFCQFSLHKEKPTSDFANSS